MVGFMRWSCFVFVALLAAMAVGCATLQDAEDNDGDVPAREDARAPSPDYAADAEGIKTVQLHPTRLRRSGIPIDAQMPVVRLGTGDQLRLSFDLMELRGRPLTVHFYHASREWERRLSPGEYMRGFQRDDLVNYTGSEGTTHSYTHYSYTFPNENIDFLVSGNYVVRVTEQGNEDAVLFERSFFVVEDEADTDLLFDRYTLPGFSGPGVQPILRVRPPRDLEGRVFDFTACFVRDGRMGDTRCVDRPQLIEQPTLRFELPRRHVFEPLGGDYRLDLRVLRPNYRISSVDRSDVPFRVQLEPDLARFPDPGTDVPLNGRIVLSRVTAVPDPATNGEYVRAHFRYVPVDEERLDRDVAIVGSFNNWRTDNQRVRLEWNEAGGYYEGSALVKQGEYEYRYVAEDDRQRQSLAEGMPPRRSTYTVFVYYRDPQLNSDRLIAVTDGAARS